MARSPHYSPAISRFLVSVLYHEAKRRKMPMTRLADQIIRDSLQDSPGWQQAANLGVVTSAPLSASPKAA